MNDTPANLTVVDNQLLLRPKLRQGENLAGYLLRLANLNCLQHPQELLEYLGQKSISRYQPSLSPQLGIYSLEKLALQLGQPVEELASLAWPFDVRVGKHRKFQYKGGAWPQELLRYSYRAWCPCCLAENAMHLAAWDWQLTTYCSKHQVLLVDTCPACQRRVSWRYASLHHCSCGFLIDQAPAIAVNCGSSAIEISTLSAIEIQRYITLSLLQQESLAGKLDVAALAEDAIEQRYAYIGTISIDQVQSKDAYDAALFTCFDHRHALHAALGPRFAVSPALQGLKIDAAFDQELACLSNQWLTNQARASPSSSSTESGAAPRLPLETVAVVLNASTHVVRRLIKDGLLSEILEGSSPNSRRHCDTFVSYESLRQLQALLGQKTTQHENGQLVSFDHFGIDFATRLNLLSGLKQRKAGVIAYDFCTGLPSLVLRRDCDYISAVPTQLSVRDAARALDIYPDAVYRLAKAGLLRYRPYCSRQLRIHVDDLHAFQRTYIFIRELAKQLACNATNLADKLMSVGLKPVHGPGVDKGLIYVFKREEVEAIDLTAIAAQRSYQSRCGRGHKLLVKRIESKRLAATVACQFLDIKPHQLDTLCHLGFLTPSQTEGDGLLYFEAADLENYLADYRKNSDLILMASAKESLKKEGARFWQDLIRLGLISLISDGLTDYCQKDQLQAAIASRKSMLSTAELSTLSGVKKARIRWESKYGCLAGMIMHLGSGQIKFYFPRSAIKKLKKLSIATRSSLTDGGPEDA
ncbi:TniQ family protein [Pseudogulbenkiania sp. NH8B]|uniref:TniQ family protein n=1 Tax=Pseudogulbenkiania sp. (strain NH8B) TaxID=748280 RepID=UPI000306CB6A|nr:TniQ family protein [Pseudogulbenkiania sp. NH8B]